jgi:hypothetical protein
MSVMHPHEIGRIGNHWPAAGVSEDVAPFLPITAQSDITYPLMPVGRQHSRDPGFILNRWGLLPHAP